ncbi:MAG: hypothetical protein C0490_27650 [Marivirga sp.]|nr:hypothetical protein [Marivirga sp.]
MDKLGKIMKKKDGFEITFERTLDHNIHVVWEAITDPARLAAWFTDIEMDFVPGGKMIIRFKDEARTESIGRIVRIQRPHVFEFTWEDELAIFELFSINDSSCKLLFTYSNLADNYVISVPAGWHLLLDQLEAVLNGEKGYYPFGGDETAAAKKMKAVYAKIVTREYPDLVIPK